MQLLFKCNFEFAKGQLRLSTHLYFGSKINMWTRVGYARIGGKPRFPFKVRTDSHITGLRLLQSPTNLVPKARSPWPAVGKRELWEQPSQACAIACHRFRLRLRSESDNQNSVISFVISKMDAPRALVFRPLVKGNKALGTRLVSFQLDDAKQWRRCLRLFRVFLVQAQTTWKIS